MYEKKFNWLNVTYLSTFNVDNILESLLNVKSFFIKLALISVPRNRNYFEKNVEDIHVIKANLTV